MIIPFTLKIPADTTMPVVLDTYEFPEDGIIYKVDIDIPAGWSYTAGVKLLIDNNEEIPTHTNTESFITGDDSNYSLYTIKKVQKGQKMSVIGVNYDSVDHYCVLLVTYLSESEYATLKSFQRGED